MSKKNLILIFVVVLVVISIWYLEAGKTSSLGVKPEGIALSGETDTSASSTTPSLSADDLVRIADKKAKYPEALELADIKGYINSPAFTLKSLIGKKVILLDFWTYSCINCQRTLPYLKSWYDKYKDDGLEIVGVHTPEFDFEKEYDNVAKAVKEDGVTYPVVLDSDMGTWNAYQNRFWPHEYLIDIDGFIVDDHIGEGGYDDTEKAIQKALSEKAKVLGEDKEIDTTIVAPKDAVTMDSSKVLSPETYFGADRNEYFGNGTQANVGNQTLTLPAKILQNVLYLGGKWNFQGEFAQNKTAEASIVFSYSAKNVYFVASSGTGVTAKVTLDGKPLGTFAGADVSADGTVFIKDNKLYNLVKGEDYGNHVIRLDIENPGLQAFTFTFG